MDFKKLSIVLSIVIVVLIAILIYFFKFNDKDTDQTNNQDEITDDSSNLDNDTYDTSDYNIVCLPDGAKIYRDLSNEEIETEIIGEEKRYWQIGEFSPTQKIYKFDESEVDVDVPNMELYVENMGIRVRLDVFSEEGEISSNSFSDAFVNIEMDENEKEELIESMVIFREIFYFIDLHENDYNKYMTEKVYQRVIEADNRLDGLYGSKSNLYKTLEEFQDSQKETMGDNYYGCIAIDTNHIILEEPAINIRNKDIVTDDKVLFEKIDNKWTIVETTMLKETKGYTWGPDGIADNVFDIEGDLDE
jgi:hypothetical protein